MLTLNLGLRYDQFKSVEYDDISLDRSSICPWRATIPGAEVLNWKDVSPRLGPGLRRVRYWSDRGEGHVQPVRAAGSESPDQPGASGDCGHQQHRPYVDRRTTISSCRAIRSNPALHAELGPSPNNNFGKPQTTLQL